MALQSNPATKVDYPFLAHPPQTTRTEQPPYLQATTTRCRSNTFSSIAAWAAHVQPGSPASLSPRSPRRRPSLGRGRRPSITSIRTPSASFFHVAPTPTPSIGDFKADLTAVGYTSVFLRLPNTPVSATLSFSAKPPSPKAAKHIPISSSPSSTCKPRGLTRFRSLSILRSRRRSKSICPDSPTKMKAKAAAASAAVLKRKKAKYAVRPPPLVNELALMQFADGGNMDETIKRAMEAQAQVTGASGLTEVYRDGRGGVWLDRDEEWEYTHLLAEGDASRPRAAGDPQWVTFGTNTSPLTAYIPETGDGRRGSLSTQDSDLDPKYIVEPVDALGGDDLAFFGTGSVPFVGRKPCMYTSRSRRYAHHLRKSDLLVDVAFLRSHATLKSPKSLLTPGSMKPKGKARRRPTPLQLLPPSPASKRPTNSPIDPDRVRQDFIEASFKPELVMDSDWVPVSPVTSTTAVDVSVLVDARARVVGGTRMFNVPRRTVRDELTVAGMGMKRKPSVLNMLTLFRSGRREDAI